MENKDSVIKRKIILLSILTFIGIITILSGMYFFIKVVTGFDDPSKGKFILLICSMLVIIPIGIIMMFAGRKLLKKAVYEYTMNCEQIELRDPKKMRKLKIIARIFWIGGLIAMVLTCGIVTFTLSDKLNGSEMFDYLVLALIIPLCIFFIGLIIEGLIIFAHENYMNDQKNLEDNKNNNEIKG